MELDYKQMQEVTNSADLGPETVPQVQQIQTSTEPKPMGERHGFAKWGGLVVLTLALVIIIIDTTILNVAFSTILNDLHATIESMQWVITAYALMLAAFTITGGRLGDIFGRKRMFMLGAIIFAIGSFISSISHNVGTLILGEAIIEGIGAALMLPATSSLLITNYEGRDRATAFGVWGAAAGVASAIGPILGGYLTTDFSWRWGFRVNIVVTLLLLAGSYLIHEAKETLKKTSIDFGGVVLSALGLLSIVFGIIKASDFGWIKSKEPFHLFGKVVHLGQLSPTPLFVLLGLLILVWFCFYELRVSRKGDVPLIDLDIFKNRQFVVGAVTTGLTTLTMTGIIFTLPVFLESVRGYTALHTGVALLPLSAALLIASPLAVYLSRRIQPRYMIATGILMTAGAAVWMHFTITQTVSITQLMWPLSLYGFGIGLVLSQISNITLSAVSSEQAGEASGINNTVRQLGSTLGSAIIGAVLISVLVSNLRSGVQNSPALPEQSKTGITTAAVAQSSSIEFGNSIVLGSSTPQAIKDEVSNVAHAAVTVATRTTLWYTAGFGVLAFLFSFTLPLRKNHPEDAIPKTTAAAGAGSSPDSLPALKNPGRMTIDEALAATSVSEIVQQPQPVNIKKSEPAPVPLPVQLASVESLYVQKKSNAPVIFAGVFALLVAAAAGLFGGYEWGVHHEKTKLIASAPAQPGPLYSILAQPTTDTVNTQPLSDADQADKQHSEVLGSSIVAPSDTGDSVSATPSTPVTPQPAPTKTYTYSGASFAITVPSTWTVSETDQDGTILRLVDGSSAVRGQFFIQAGVSETLSQKRRELQANSQVSNIADTTFHGIPAISYTKAGVSGTNIVLEYAGNLYTLSQGAQLEGNGYSIRFF